MLYKEKIVNTTPARVIKNVALEGINVYKIRIADILNNVKTINKILLLKNYLIESKIL